MSAKMVSFQVKDPCLEETMDPRQNLRHSKLKTCNSSQICRLFIKNSRTFIYHQVHSNLVSRLSLVVDQANHNFISLLTNKSSMHK